MKTITEPNRRTVSAAELTDFRATVETALRHYAATAPNGAAPTATGITVLELAENVGSWTHTTRLRDFIASRTAGL